jgi:hypothetical protein
MHSGFFPHLFSHITMTIWKLFFFSPWKISTHLTTIIEKERMSLHWSNWLHHIFTIYFEEMPKYTKKSLSNGTQTHIHVVSHERKMYFVLFMYTYKNVKNQSCLQDVSTLLHIRLSYIYLCTSLYINMLLSLIHTRMSACSLYRNILPIDTLSKETSYFINEKQIRWSRLLVNTTNVR